MHGSIHSGWLVKRGKQVVKFYKHNGYGIPADILPDVKGVILYTEYDGVLYQTSHVIMRDGMQHTFGDELQYVLPVEKWRVRDDTTREA